MELITSFPEQPTPVSSTKPLPPTPQPAPQIIEPQNQKKRLITVLLVICFLSIAGLSTYFLSKGKPITTPRPIDTVACTQEAKLCPDGTSVGRTGPNCEFAPCPQATPGSSIPSNWKTYTDTTFGYSLKYPENWNQGAPKIAGENTIVLTPASVDKIGTQIQAVYLKTISNPKHLTSIDYYNQILKPSQEVSTCTNPLINSAVPASLKAFDATIIEGLCGVLSQGPRTVIANDNYILDISSSFTEQVDNNLIYQILSTFKFPSQPTSSIPTDWKTYTNIEYQYSFRYPPIIEITTPSEAELERASEISASVEDKNHQQFSVIFTIWDNPKALDLQQLCNDIFSCVGTPETEKKTINGIIWEKAVNPYQIQNSFYGFVKYATIRKNISYFVSIKTETDLFSVEEILSTFQFTK